MDSITGLAKLFKERDNKEHMGIKVGAIQSVNPLIVSLGSKIILNASHLYVSEHLMQHEREIQSTGNIQIGTDITRSYESTGEMVFKPCLKTGDQVVLMPTADEQQFIILDKVVKL